MAGHCQVDRHARVNDKLVELPDLPGWPGAARLPERRFGLGPAAAITGGGQPLGRDVEADADRFARAVVRRPWFES